MIARGGKISLQLAAIVGIKPLGCVTLDSREQTRATTPRAAEFLSSGNGLDITNTEYLSLGLSLSIRYGKRT